MCIRYFWGVWDLVGEFWAFVGDFTMEGYLVKYLGYILYIFFEIADFALSVVDRVLL